MQPIELPIAAQLTNQFSFILEPTGSQPIYYMPETFGVPTTESPTMIVPGDIDAELTDYVARMAGTPFDLDRDLEAASVEHLLSDPDDV